MFQSTFTSLLIQFALFSLAFADETLKTTTHGNAWRYGTGGGVIGFIVLILDILVFSTFLTSFPFPLIPLVPFISLFLSRSNFYVISPQIPASRSTLLPKRPSAIKPRPSFSYLSLMYN